MVPGLGHLLVAAGTGLHALQRWRALRAVHRSGSGSARARMAAAEDRWQHWMETVGSPGDLWIGLTLILHLGLAALAAACGLPRIGEILLSDQGLDLHGSISLLYLAGLLISLWGLSWARTRRRAPLLGRIGRDLQRSPNGMIGLMGVCLILSLAILTPLLAPFDPLDPDALGLGLAPPGTVVHPLTGQEHTAWLGTDPLGRDVLSRTLYGARISLLIGVATILCAGTVGTTLGLLAGALGGWIDAMITWCIDLMLSIPRLVLLLAVLGIFQIGSLGGAGRVVLIVAVLGLTGWMGVSRLVRGQVLSLAKQDFVLAARALGLSPLRILTRHLLPNALGPVIVYASLAIGTTILVEAALSFLGLGISPPTPTWGNLIADGRGDLLSSPWIATFPGLLIVWTVLSFNLLGDGLRDALDPRHRAE